jgi:hypothetical protein
MFCERMRRCVLEPPLSSPRSALDSLGEFDLYELYAVCCVSSSLLSFDLYELYAVCS